MPGCETDMRRLALPLPTAVPRRGRCRVLFVAWLARVQGIQLHWPDAWILRFHLMHDAIEIGK